MTTGPQAEIQRSPSSRLIRGIIVAAVVVAVPLALVLTLVYALPKLPGVVTNTNTDIPKPPPPVDETLLATVRAEFNEATTRFNELQSAHQTLDDHFKDAFGVTLEASANKKTLPHDLIDCMAASDAPLQAWADVQNACVTQAQFKERKDVLRAVEVKIRNLDVTLTDRHDLEDVNEWATKRLSAIRGQAANIDLIRERLRAYRTKEKP
jgi:hypothetical protein